MTQINSGTSTVALFDWDETLHRGSSMEPWINYLTAKGEFDTQCSIEAKRIFSHYAEGKLSYDSFVVQLVDTYALGLKGRSVLTIERLATNFAMKDRTAIFAFARPLLDQLKSAGITPIFISGSAVEIIAAHAKLLGVTNLFATELNVTSDRNPSYTGTVKRNTATRSTKQIITANYVGCIALAAGDSNADVPMLEKADLRIVVGNPSLFPNDPNTFHISRDMRPLELASLRAFLKPILERGSLGLSA